MGTRCNIDRDKWGEGSDWLFLRAQGSLSRERYLKIGLWEAGEGRKDIWER